MPYKRTWVHPELVLEHKGVNVYRAYKDDDFDSPFTYWFVLCVDQDEDESFDVRNLDKAANDSDQILEVLKKAIDEGRLTKDGIQ